MADVPMIPQERIRQCIVAEIQGTSVSHIQEQIDEVVKAISSERIVARVVKEIEVIQVLPIMEEVTETRQRSTVTRTSRTRCRSESGMVRRIICLSMLNTASEGKFEGKFEAADREKTALDSLDRMAWNQLTEKDVF